MELLVQMIRPCLAWRTNQTVFQSEDTFEFYKKLIRILAASKTDQHVMLSVVLNFRHCNRHVVVSHCCVICNPLLTYGAEHISYTEFPSLYIFLMKYPIKSYSYLSIYIFKIWVPYVFWIQVLNKIFFCICYFFPLEYAYSFLFSYSVFRREENFKSEMQLILFVFFVDCVFAVFQNWSLIFKANFYNLLSIFSVYYYAVYGSPFQHSCLENPMDGGAW